MTDDERRMEDMMLGKHIGKEKGTIKFMQKYYHKGAFYMVSGGVGRVRTVDPNVLVENQPCSSCRVVGKKHAATRAMVY